MGRRFLIVTALAACVAAFAFAGPGGLILAVACLLGLDWARHHKEP